MKLYFENSNCERKLIAQPQTREEAMQEMIKFCEDRNFDVYYTRSWRNQEENLVVFDVGSWTEFFLLDDN